MRREIHSVLFIVVIISMSIVSCKSDKAHKSSDSAVATNATPATNDDSVPTMSAEKASGKGNRKGKLPDRTFRIKDNTVNGVKPGMRISELQNILIRSYLDLGQGRVEVFRIRDDKGGPMGYVTRRIGNSDLVGDITLTSKKALTPEGIRIGDTFEKLQSLVSGLSLTRANNGQRPHASKDNILYFLDDSKSQGDIKNAIIEEIRIRDTR